MAINGRGINRNPALKCMQAAIGLLVFCVPSPAQSPTPGQSKFPGMLFDPWRVEVAYHGEVFSQTLSYGIGGSIVSRKKCERANNTAEWECRYSSEGTSYIITGLDSRNGGDEVYVSGISQDGSCLIERWSSLARPGGWKAIASEEPVPSIGTPLPATTPVVVVSGAGGGIGGSWTPIPGSLQSLPAYTRKPLYTTNDGPLHGLAVDPEGRYVLFYDMSLKQLIRLDLTQQPPITEVIASHPSIPALDQVGAMDLREFVGQGRKCLVRREYSADFHESRELYTLLSDENNDAVFETIQTFTSADWAASPYSNWEQWRSYWYEYD